MSREAPFGAFRYFYAFKLRNERFPYPNRSDLCAVCPERLTFLSNSGKMAASRNENGTSVHAVGGEQEIENGMYF